MCWLPIGRSCHVDRALPAPVFHIPLSDSPSRLFQLLHLQHFECPSARLQHLQHSQHHLDPARAHSGSDWSIAHLSLCPLTPLPGNCRISTSTSTSQLPPLSPPGRAIRHSTSSRHPPATVIDPASDETRRTTCSVTRSRPGALLHFSRLRVRGDRLHVAPRACYSAAPRTATPVCRAGRAYTPGFSPRIPSPVTSLNLSPSPHILNII